MGNFGQYAKRCFPKRQGRCVGLIGFGLGMVVSSVLPVEVVLFLAGVLLVALGISVVRT